MNLSNSGYTLATEFKNVPVAFVNGLRRILTAEIPAVVLTNVEIVANTTNLTHEMLRHRVEQIPVNVQPTETGVLRDTKIELRVLPSPEAREITTEDFVITGPRDKILLKDRDLNTDGLFLQLAANQSVHIRATLGIEQTGIAQCVASYKNHIDPERARLDKDTWVLEGNDPREFDAYQIQRSYARDESGRPYWFDFMIDSIGITKAKDLLRTAVEIYKTKLDTFASTPVQRFEQQRYRITLSNESFTLGCLIQALLYSSGLVDWARMKTGHPLLPELTVEFDTKVSPDTVVERVKSEALALCENVLKSV